VTAADSGKRGSGRRASRIHWLYDGIQGKNLLRRGDMEGRLSHEEFVKKAIVNLRKEGYKGIHTVYSGFNEAFKKYFPGENPIEATTNLAKEGKIVIRPVKGGVMLYLPEEAPGASNADEALKKMGLA
jgi:hypothetical protein